MQQPQNRAAADLQNVLTVFYGQDVGILVQMHGFLPPCMYYGTVVCKTAHNTAGERHLFGRIFVTQYLDRCSHRGNDLDCSEDSGFQAFH